MSATNKTTHYELPVFLGSDKPAWLVDWNGAMSAIDAAIYEAYATAQSASTSAASVASDLSTLASTVSTQGTSITTLSDTLTTLVGTVNTITSLIGNGEPTTTDKTIIGAINEINAKIPSGGSVAAEDVTYDNTSSHLTATNAQAAIDELNTKIEEYTPTTIDRRIINLGDSYCVDGHMPEPNISQRLMSLFGLTTDDYYNFSENGIGFVQQGGTTTGTDTALTLLQAHASDVTSPETITDIVITLGVNDIKLVDVSPVPAAIQTLVTYIKTTYPNAKIHYGFVGNLCNNATHVADVAAYNKYRQLIMSNYKAFSDLGCDVMQGLEYIMHDHTNLGSPNYDHPNVQGANYASTFIYEWIMTGYSKYKRSITVNESGSGAVDINIDGETTYVSIRSLAHSSGTVVSNYATLMDMGANQPLWSRFYYPFVITMKLDSDTRNTSCYGRFHEGKIVAYTPGATTWNSALGMEVAVDTLRM